MTSPPRHPSAGNLSAKPTAVPDPEPPERWSPLAFPHGSEGDHAEPQLGPALDPLPVARLIGPLDGRRVLQLGCGTGADTVAMSRAGAKVIVVDPSADRLAVAREASDAAEQKVEFHHGDPAELPFIRGERIDLAISIHSLAEVDDLGRVFRQVHRVLRSESPLLVSLPHPLAIAASLETTPAPQMTRTSFDPGPVEWATDEDSGKVIPHRIADVFTTLTRSNFRVDTLWEPMSLEVHATWHWSPLAEWVPLCFVIRGKKEGI